MQVEKFIEILKTYPKGSDIVVLWYGQEEFEDATDDIWKKVVNRVDLDSADQLMREEIDDAIHSETVRVSNSTRHLKSVTL